MKFALTGYIVSMARILYVHVIGAIALLPRRDYFAMIVELLQWQGSCMFTSLEELRVFRNISRVLLV